MLHLSYLDKTTSKYMKQKLIELQGEMTKSIIRGEDFNILNNWLSKENFSENTENLRLQITQALLE